MDGENGEAIAPHEGDWLTLLSHDDPYINALRIVLNIQSAVLDTFFDKLKEQDNEEKEQQETTEKKTTETIEEES